MKANLIKLLMGVSLLTGLVACGGGGGGSSYEPSYHYNCYAVYDEYGYYMYDECYWEYYNVAGEIESRELDITSDAADIETVKLERMAVHYGEKFDLSSEQAMKVARNVKDFSALEDRTSEDYADYAEKLYGVNPDSIVSAVGKAQVGQNAELDALISEAAINFETSAENTRELIKELHGNALEANGIEL